MKQLSFLPSVDPKGIVNVASVPQRSLFRYPGGKTWFVPWFRRWMGHLPSRPRRLVEPFCGGGIIGLTALMEGLADQVVLGEIDPHVSSVWRVLVEGNYEALARRIVDYPISRKQAIEDLEREPSDDVERAFQTILRNRVQHGGIMAPGARMMRTGENGRGIGSRWYPETLARRIMAIGEHRDRLSFVEGDAFSLISSHLDEGQTAFFLDPPYTAGGKRAGRRLYECNSIDHRHLFELTARVKGWALLTYDDNPEVRKLAEDWGFQIDEVPMKGTHHASMTELVICNVACSGKAVLDS